MQKTWIRSKLIKALEKYKPSSALITCVYTQSQFLPVPYRKHNMTNTRAKKSRTSATAQEGKTKKKSKNSPNFNDDPNQEKQGGFNPEKSTTAQNYFKFIKSKGLASEKKVERDRIHHHLSSRVQDAIKVGEVHGLLCDMRFQPILESMSIEALNKFSAEEKLILRRGRIARDRIVEMNLRLVTTIAKKTWRKASTRVEILDLIQSGTLGLVRAIEKFDSTKGYSFSTYAYRWIWNSVLQEISHQERIIRMPSMAVEMVKRLERGEANFQTEKEELKVRGFAETYKHCLSSNWIDSDRDTNRDLSESIPDPTTSQAAQDEELQRSALSQRVQSLLGGLALHEKLAVEAAFAIGWFARYDNGRSDTAPFIKIEQRIRDWLSANPSDNAELLAFSLSRRAAQGWYEDGVAKLRAGKGLGQNQIC